MFVCSCFLNEALLPCAEFSLRGCSEYLQCINCSNKWNETKDSFLCIYLVSTKPKFFIAKEGFFFKNCSAPYISVYLTYRHALFHISSVVGFTVISELKITVGAYCADVKCLLVTKVGTKIGIYNGGGVIPAPDQIWTFVKTLMNLRATEGAVDFFVSWATLSFSAELNFLKLVISSFLSLFCPVSCPMITVSVRDLYHFLKVILSSVV